MPTFIKADDDVVRLIAHTMQKYHPDLVDAGVTVSAVMAIAKVDDNGDPVGPALMHNGYPALAQIRIVPHKQRVQGMADAEMTIDGDRWTFIDDQNDRIALIDHELEHLALDEEDRAMRDANGKIVTDKDGRPRKEVKRDDGGRPKLKMRLHDHQIGWFDKIAKRHGKHSQEMQQARALVDASGQVYFPYLLDVEGTEKEVKQVQRELAGVR